MALEGNIFDISWAPLSQVNGEGHFICSDSSTELHYYKKLALNVQCNKNTVFPSLAQTFSLSIFTDHARNILILCRILNYT
jgi:hypothetical protein